MIHTQTCRPAFNAGLLVLHMLIAEFDPTRVIYTGVVGYISLPKAFLISKPAELVHRFANFREVRELKIELFCILKLVRQYHRKLKNLQQGYFY